TPEALTIAPPPVFFGRWSPCPASSIPTFSRYQPLYRQCRLPRTKTDAAADRQPPFAAVPDSRDHSFLRDGCCAQIRRNSRFTLWTRPRPAASFPRQE